MKAKPTLKFLTQAAVIAALYAALTVFLAPISYGPVQFRVAEALTLLPVLTPAAIPGLAIGCVIANLASGYGMLDIVFGSLATLLAAVLSYFLRNMVVSKLRLPVLSAIPPVICNALIVPAVIVYAEYGSIAASPPAVYWTYAWQIGLSELVICFLLGLALVAALRKVPAKLLALS
ncbi:MAG: QueT transporter family protein [Oscillospiraceae bacterium]|jgi:uncharacterized membrane protein|nr:QueT transporter family protein [Oscillospiraceae bacterium]